jgi:hypothetical protein
MLRFRNIVAIFILFAKEVSGILYVEIVFSISG